MGKTKGMVGLLTLALLAGPLFLVEPAAAENECEGMRTFSGLIQGFKKKGKKAGFVLDNRQGDKVRFNKPEEVLILDQRTGGKKKAEVWKDIKNGWYASVCWKFTDDPRLAYKVMLKDKPAEDAVDQ
ncbi:MAG: hypothetical protein CL910_02460 [Deltaproteobacteria bacterium]|jgi:hypothetical protein|nr:hypothetical protein [Deltaproteobacteria bacterium]